MTAQSPPADSGGADTRQTLAARLALGPLPLSAGLSYAAQIARELRDLHARGGAHGHIATSAIVLDAAGASLAESLHYTDGAFASRDVRGWGAMLQELVGAGEDVPGERKGPEAVLPSARRLARKCMARSPEGQLTMQQAYNEVRVLAMLAKQYRLDQEPARSGSLRLSSFGKAEEKRPTPRPPSADRVRNAPVPRSTYRGLIPSWSAS